MTNFFSYVRLCYVMYELSDASDAVTRADSIIAPHSRQFHVLIHHAVIRIALPFLRLRSNSLVRNETTIQLHATVGIMRTIAFDGGALVRVSFRRDH